MNKFLMGVAFTIGIVGIAAGAFWLGKQGGGKTPVPTVSPMPLASTAPTSQPAASPGLFSGQVKRLTADLALFSFSTEDTANGIPSSVSYYEAGTFTRGTHKDYKRIIAVRPSGGPGPDLIFILATKDDALYVLDDPDNLSSYPADDWDNPMKYLDKSKVTTTAVFENEHPQVIGLPGDFSLYRESVTMENVTTGKKNSGGYDEYENRIVSQSPSDTSLALSQSVPKLVARAIPKTKIADSMPPKEKEKQKIRDLYLASTTGVVAFDSAGLPYSYLLSTTHAVTAYAVKKKSFDAAIKTYKEQYALFTEKKIETPPDSPPYPELPNLRFAGVDVETETPLYKLYDVAIPHSCGMDVNTYVLKNVTDKDLVRTGTLQSRPVYHFKDTKHPLLSLEYAVKVDYDDMMFKDANPGPKPTFEQYIVKQPLLVFKDAWGRYVALGEYDYILPGGCGKPVVYLYPPRDTDVTVRLPGQTSIVRSVPVYEDRWHVHADPWGNLSDLSPARSCASIDGTYPGLAYAPAACRENRYPYLYWSGTIKGVAYPKASGGWAVSRDELPAFLAKRIRDAGLNEKEATDMAAYWTPVLLAKNAPYYRISFLQTRELNAFAPMTITPRPDTVIRLFLDWEPLTGSVRIEPQDLQAPQRNGFTVVEWGGLKQ